ncbi:putative MFS transporter [Microdochium trichocladiopsis]|uniref:MFS transporter n=1 Tax=Microdochium trichocladiopsis TaxID=1682393 RepID=A0A9P9BK06_9PEZI|nr:putative MFS transporter [Microdochium trichocladiopsis]KAH7020744.1 putative MFS transporter [Microdochium trichocladiopsis]
MAEPTRRSHEYYSASALEEGDHSDVMPSAQAANEKQVPMEDSPAPDGGLEAWLVVMGGFCVSFCSFGWLNSIGVFQGYYQTGPLSAYTSSTIAWIPSLQIFFMMAMGPIVGILYDRFGPRYLLLGGSVLHVFGLMMASLATEYYQFLLAQGVCSAIGVAAIFQPAINPIPSWFSTRRGAAYGILATGSSLGGVVFPIMLSRLVQSVGYPWAMRAAAFLILALLVVANCTVKARLPPNPQRLTPAQLAQPFKEVPFLGLLAGMVLLTFGIYIPINYIQVEALQAGMRPELAGYLVTTLNAGSLFGRILSGVAADKIGRFNAFIMSCFFAGFFTLALWIPTSSTTAAATRDGIIIAFSVLFGFFSGAYVSLLGALVAAISPPREIGFRTGLVFLVAAVPGLVTNPIAGAILSSSSGSGGGSFVGVKVFAGVLILAGTLCVSTSRGIATSWKLMVAY